MLRKISMRKRNPKPSGLRRGTTTVEFSVVAPALFILVVGAMQLFRFYAVANSVEMAVLEGARRGLLNSGHEPSAIQAAQGYLETARLSKVDVNAVRTKNTDGKYVLTITANCPMSGNGFLVPPGNKLVIQRQCSILCESNL